MNDSTEIDWADFIRKPDDKSRWFELFGTPERAARTLAGIVTADGCVDCALLDATCCRNKDAWLGWLRGDAE